QSRRAWSDSLRWWRITARRRSASASSAGSLAPSAVAIAASYDAIASEMRAARSCARAPWSRSAAARSEARGPVRKGPVFSVADMATSPGDGVVGEVVQSSGHVLPEEVIQRQHVDQDGQRVGGIRDPLGQDRPEQVAVRVAYGERGGPLEYEALRLKPNAVHV